MRPALIAVVMWAWLGCPLAPVPAPVDAGVTPVLEVSSPVVDVGVAALLFGQHVRREGVVSIRASDLEAPLDLDVVATDPACLGSACAARVSLTLAPGEWLQVPVALDLAVVGPVVGVVTFSPRTPQVAPRSVTVLGNGTAAPDCLVAEPSSIDFGTLNQGCPVRQRPLRLTNGCVVPRLLGSGELTPLNTPFVLSTLTALPRRLAPGETWSGLAEFLGGTPGLHEALLAFRVDGEIAAAIGLTGFRSETGAREFSFAVQSRDLDVLVVLDSSPSFVPRRLASERRIVTDVSDPSWYAGPLRVGVVGTGGTALVPAGSQSFFENDQLDFATNVGSALAAIPSNGDEVERCLETAAQLAGGTSFWRDGSRRMAVCITDAPEQSPAPLSSIAILADAGVRWEVVGPPLAPPDGGCQVEAFDDGGGHVAFTAALDGSVTSICAPWRLPMMPPTPPPPTRFTLAVVPNFPLTVWADGSLVPETEWSWESATRTLVLRSAPVSTLVIRESPSCPQ